jgi:hypothetical protein
MASTRKRSEAVARISVAVAVCSLFLNAVQFYSSYRDKSEDRQRRREDRAPVAFLGYCNDQTLKMLYTSGLSPGADTGISALTVRHGGPADLQIQAYLERLRVTPRSSLRSKPVASFLVIGNRGDQPLRDVRAVSSPNDAVILSTSLVNPKEYVFVPLEFQPPGNDAGEPDTPAEITVHDANGNSRRIRPTDRIDWLGGQFVRGLIRNADLAPTAK